MVAPAPLTVGYRSTPYWWDDVDLPRPPGGAVPPTVDVAVVGGGYTGLAAAFELARRGRQVAVLERDGIGAGASGRNGGMVHPGGKLTMSEFLALPGGTRLWDDTVAAFESIEALCAEHGLDCDWRRTGHVELAHHPRLARSLQAEAEAHRSVGEEARYIPAGELGAEVGSERFCGGLLVTRAGGLHPAKLVGGLARLAGEAGAGLHPDTVVEAVGRDGAGYRVVTSRGALRCGEVVVATNGTTDRRPVPWLGRRVLGIGSFILATEQIEPHTAASVSPRGRMLFDTRNFLHYWRLSPDGRRVLFGGRTSLAPTTVERARDRLYADMVRIHPQLAGTRVDRAWGGRVALTADRLPHLGRDPVSGVVYAMGYCGSGVAMAVHLGRAVGRWLGGEDESSPFAERAWPPMPWPARSPLVAAGGLWFGARDLLGR